MTDAAKKEKREEVTAAQSLVVPKAIDRDAVTGGEATRGDDTIGDAEQRAADLAPPLMVGPYAVGAPMGGGGAGTVYRARGPDGADVALKLLDARVIDGRLQARFAREASIRLDHPNVVAVRDAGTASDGRPYLALELLEGESLAHRLRRGTLSPKEARDVGVQVCKGLEAAHAAGIVHRDLKPDNLFLCRDGTVKIVDFGIALLATDEQRLTRTGIIIGTPSYLSPEQASGEENLDHRVDLWAMGAVLYECLTGEAPFDRETSVATVMAIVAEELTPFAEKRADVPEALAAVIEKCLVKDRDFRVQTAQDLRVALEAVDLAGATSAPATKAPVAAGEQRIVAVLLAQELRDLAVAQAAIEEHGGTFVPLMGNRAVGLFGNKAWQGDELPRAAIAAEAVRRVAGAVSISLGHMSGSRGSVSGEAMRLAEEGCATKTTGVVVDAKAARALARNFELEEVRQDLYRITGRKRRSSMAPAPTEELLIVEVGDSLRPGPRAAPLLGRAVEIAQLRRALDTVLDEQRAQAALVVGPAGIGKSRLHRALLDMLGNAEQPVRVLQARAESIGMSGALSVIADALRRRARMGVKEGWPRIDSPDLEECQHAVVRLAEEAIVDATLREESTPFLGELLGIAMTTSPALQAAQKDAQVMSDRLRVAVFDYMAGLVEQGPLALCIEDLHWADPGTLKILEELMERSSAQPFLVFATARPQLDEERPDYLQGIDVVRIVPAGLLPSDVATLARSTAGREITPAVAKKIAERTGGNPLFVEQVVLELAERELLDSPPDELPLPLTVEAAIQSRLDHLPLVEKTTCKRASILGRPFSADELEGLGVADAKGQLEALRVRGIISARAIGQVGKGREYRFTHALLSEVAYNMIAAEPRRELHQRAAVVLLRAPESERDDEEIGAHHERGDEKEKAGARFTTAAITANRKGDGDKTLRTSDKALALGAPDHHRFELHMARSETLQFLGRYDDQAKDLDEAWTRATTDADKARVLIDRHGNHWWTGKTAEAGEAAIKAVSHATLSGDPDEQARALFKHAGSLMYSGQHQAAREALDATTPLLDKCDLQTRGLVENGRGMLAVLTGDFAENYRAMSAAVESNKEAGNLRRAAMNENNLGDCLNRLGAFTEAEAALRKAMETAKRVGNRRALDYARPNLAFAMIALRRPLEALGLLEGQPSGDKRTTAVATKFRAAALMDAGEISKALEHASQAVDAFETISENAEKAEALTLAADAEIKLGNPRRAIQLSTLAIALRDELGAVQVDEARIFTVHAEALEANGRAEEARAVLARGKARLLEMAGKITDPAWRKRFLEDVPCNRELLERAGERETMS